jgi:hypothetical protein
MEETFNISSEDTTTFLSKGIPIGQFTTMNTWSTPQRVDVIEYADCIEFIYKETSMLIFTIYPPPPPEERVFKIVYSCVDGKLNKSEKIYGKIIPSQKEYYEFED